MKLSNSTFFRWRNLIFTLLFIVGCAIPSVYGRPAGVELLLQQSPFQGGTVMPGVGIHSFKPNAQVSLTAVPKPGFQFAYWLGDVGDPTASRTTVHLGSSKVVVAVFERIEKRHMAKRQHMRSSGSQTGGAGHGGGGGGSSGGGGLIAPVGDYSSQGSSGDGGVGSVQRPHRPVATVYVPEPATILLLTFGAVFLRKTRGPDGKKFI